jgi:hypothetical protein
VTKDATMLELRKIMFSHWWCVNYIVYVVCKKAYKRFIR